jgi:hypothetical protein
MTQTFEKSMWCRVAVTMALLAAWQPVSADEDRPMVWGDRFFDKEVAKGVRIVVDERGHRNLPNSDEFGDSQYVWRRIDAGKDDGPILLVIPGSFMGGTLRPFKRPIELLHVGLTPNGDLITIFNQRITLFQPDKCWAYVARARPDGKHETMPKLSDLPPNSDRMDSSMSSTKLKSAIPMLNEQGTFIVNGWDLSGAKMSFALRSRTYFQEVQYYWEQLSGN